MLSTLQDQASRSKINTLAILIFLADSSILWRDFLLLSVCAPVCLCKKRFSVLSSLTLFADESNKGWIQDLIINQGVVQQVALRSELCLGMCLHSTQHRGPGFKLKSLGTTVIYRLDNNTAA